MSARTSLPEKKLAKALDRINRAQSRFARRYPGDSGARGLSLPIFILTQRQPSRSTQRMNPAAWKRLLSSM